MLKKSFDIIFVVIFSPFIIFLFLITFFLSLIFNKKNIFFYQYRGGYLGGKISIIKFRTMEHETKEVSRFNSFLRKTRLDEIPQFLSVITGDLSIVGPRPLHYEYKNTYTEEQYKRFNLKPGITGLAQINQKKNMTWTEQFNIDIWYVENCSFMLDLKIIFKTIIIIFKSLLSKETKDKEKFTGNN